MKFLLWGTKAVLCLALSSCLPPQKSLRSDSTNTQRAVWPFLNDTLVIMYHLNQNILAHSSEIEKAAKSWNRNSRFRLIRGNNTTVVNPDADKMVSVSLSINRNPFTELGRTIVRKDSLNPTKIIDADIIIDYRSPGMCKMISICVHEFGHVFGLLDDPSDQGLAMYSPIRKLVEASSHYENAFELGVDCPKHEFPTVGDYANLTELYLRNE